VYCCNPKEPYKKSSRLLVTQPTAATRYNRNPADCLSRNALLPPDIKEIQQTACHATHCCHQIYIVSYTYSYTYIQLYSYTATLHAVYSYTATHCHAMAHTCSICLRLPPLYKGLQGFTICLRFPLCNICLSWCHDSS